MRSSETLRNSLGPNHESSAYQLSYAGKITAHINGRCLVKQVADRVVLVAAWRDLDKNARLAGALTLFQAIGH